LEFNKHMRITTGHYKGRSLLMPKGIRPTQDKVRKAIFDILGDITGLSFLELFAGSGAVGFEALSRGVSELVLVEYNRDCQLAIRKNIDGLKATTCTLYPSEAEKAISALHKAGRRFNIVFLDPPYHLPSRSAASSASKPAQDAASLAKKTLQTLGAYDIVTPNGFVIVQHFKRDQLPQELKAFCLVKESCYGDTYLSFYQKKE